MKTTVRKCGKMTITTTERTIVRPSDAFTDRELATVLAALRYWQIGDGLSEYEDYFEEHTPLTEDEIDDLCERINRGE